MKLLKTKKGYTLVELLAVIAIITIIATFTFSMFGELNRLSNARVDQSRITIYNKAFEDFRFTDYSTLQSVPKEKVTVVSNGKVKINQYLNLSPADINALSNSGRGRYPATFQECVATIRAYCGTNDILPAPAAGMSYSYFYNINQGKCYVYETDNPSVQGSNWINLNEYYHMITNYKLGDANGDGSVNINDVNYIKKLSVGLITEQDPYKLECADVNRDGNITVKDYELLQKHLAGQADINWW